jgi:hypothetical protein
MQTEDTHPDIPETKPGGASPALRLAVEAALAELPQRIPSGLSPLERVEAERIRQAAERWAECGTQLATDGLTVEGSMDQLRPHPLLKIEQALRREVSEGLRKLIWLVDQRATVERINTLTRHASSPNPSPPRPAPRSSRPRKAAARKPAAGGDVAETDVPIWP